MTRISLRDFRSYDDADLELGPGLTVVYGANGAGKTNLLEGLYFGCTGRSFRTSDERQLVRHGAKATRVVVSGSDADGTHELAVGLAPGEGKRMTSDGAPVERLLDVSHRPLISVFSPDRLELVKGSPGLRRAHLDQFVAALPGQRAPRPAATTWPRSLSATRCSAACVRAASPATRWLPGTWRWRPWACAWRPTAPRPSSRSSNRSRSARSSSACAAPRRSPTAGARTPPRRRSSPPRSPPASTPISPAGTPPTGPTATTS